jgi:hypothetical protein
MHLPYLAAAIAALALLASGAVSAQTDVRCESRNFQHQFCPVNGDVTGARLVSQESRSACVQGRSWGWNSSGVWVTNGCTGRFRVDAFVPPPPGFGPQRISCDSRNFQYEFCSVGVRVVNASLVRQRSRSACVLGRTWGWRADGIWVSEGCQGDFQLQSSFNPVPPPGPGFTVCESREFRYNFCGTGPIRNAQMVTQISNAPCIQGRTWGTTRDGIWVDNGCSARFRVFSR